MIHGRNTSCCNVRTIVLIQVYKKTDVYLHPLLIDTPKSIRSSWGPMRKNFAFEFPETDVHKITAIKKIHIIMTRAIVCTSKPINILACVYLHPYTSTSYKFRFTPKPSQMFLYSAVLSPLRTLLFHPYLSLEICLQISLLPLTSLGSGSFSGFSYPSFGLRITSTTRIATVTNANTIIVVWKVLIRILIWILYHQKKMFFTQK